MMWLGIAIMAVGFIGVLACAKIKNQPLQVVSAIVMLAGLGVYFYAYLNQDQAYARDWTIYRMAVAQSVAKELNGAQAIWVTNDITSESSKEAMKAFADAGGNAEWKMITSPDSGMIDDKALAELLKGLTKDNYLVLDVGLMENNAIAIFKKLLTNSNCPKIILTENASGMEGKMLKIDKAFKDGKIIAAVTNKSDIDIEFHPDENDLTEAFNARFVMVKADNFDNFKANFGY